MTVDPDEIPRLLESEELSRIFADYFKRRLQNNDNVDRHALPTASLASAMRLLRFDDRETRPLLDWLRRDDFVSSYAAVQQAALWLDDVELATCSKPTGSDLEAIYEILLSLRAGRATAEQIHELFALLISEEVPLTRKAIVAESLVRYGDAQTFARAATAAMSLQNDLEQAMSSERAPLEVICLLTAFIVRVHAAQELAAGSVHYEAHDDIRQPDLESDLRRDLDLARGELNAGLERLAQTREFGSRAVGWAVSLGLVLTFGLAALLIVVLGASWTAWVAISVPAVTAILAMVSYVGHRAKRYESEPRIMAELRRCGGPEQPARQGGTPLDREPEIQVLLCGTGRTGVGQTVRLTRIARLLRQVGGGRIVATVATGVPRAADLFGSPDYEIVQLDMPAGLTRWGRQSGGDGEQAQAALAAELPGGDRHGGAPASSSLRTTRGSEAS